MNQLGIWGKLPRPLKILAPMEDVTDTAFRQIVMECGRPDLMFTEFTSTTGLISKGRQGVIRRLKYKEEEKPLIAQIWGNFPEKYTESCELLVEMGFDGIDINMGCPVHKIVKKGCCSALIDNPELAGEIIQACKKASGDLPVSVKTRIGFKSKKTEEWTKFLLDQGIAALTMHGRLSKDMSKYPADWDEIGKVVEIRDKMGVDTLIIGNGDVESLEQIDEKVEQYGVDGVMIGRGIFKDPFLFNPDKSIEELDIKQRLDLLLRHAELFVKEWGDTRNFAILKKFFKIYVSNFDGAVEMRVKLMECAGLEEVRETVKRLS